MQHRLSRERLTRPEGPRIFGEVFAFDDLGSRLPAIERLEGFDPVDASSHYRHVPLPVETNEDHCLLAWAYVVAEYSEMYLPEGNSPP